ncbi:MULTISPECIES: 5,6-dimethylbenzimidazole synthase [unclassified Bradyrhizobium]|uniref:5,6-dimethylbenzimidazole synthase n=1 Tax=unclassified Bradyrhizobium TaxID=2631580 RepID=UPI00211DDD6E|nr:MULTISPECIES: 5,6-dimethylbenzimidazole synthase [unclassified Bradyrhizobium]MDD1533224.1 5,6-dimethylbenzimidazole synthase [Bradyrhizobium sp. WBOS8]MDD1582878.1 5,6-dimethylbenzimidazole synthase [Bradyrhizobium sp. WBOS4]UUO48268.1 5,6-dimethylbenzimidazole synthase [Bradyrhizobium sp. WBOS04]UUO61889.1 5,6-dimethylbenzimidazole synthase [Bradyrhizobium sp. WBOS08]
MVEFDDSFRRQLHELFVWRRDVRRFRSDRLPDGAMDRLIETACLSPSVGLSQPWRFVIVDDAACRRAVIDDFRACNADALSRYSGERAARYATLKLSGLEQAPGHLAVFADKTGDIGHGLGRATMPETTEYSVVAAITAMWLAARSEGIGLGWVSILNPDRVHAILDVPASWKFIAYLCIGYPEAECDQPELEQAKWEHRRGSDEFTLRR